MTMGDLSWYARKAAAAKARQAALEQAAEEVRAAAERPWVEFVAAREGWNAAVFDGWFQHGHAAHGATVTVDAATGAVLGVGCVVIDENAPPIQRPDVCPVCRDFPTYREEHP